MADLPQEVIEEILPRLPVKSLLRFKTASKLWYSLISKNHKFHMKQSSFPSKNLLFYELVFVDQHIFILQYSDIDSNESRRVNFPLEIATPCRLIGSANGLICVASWDKPDCFIWNPCTNESKRISVPVEEAGYCLFGFGYDSTSDDHKILGHSDPHLRIFSLKTNSWKVLEHDYSFVCTPELGALHSNGALHWCVDSQIAAFDLAEEKLSFMKLPEDINYVSDDGYCLIPLFDYQGPLGAHSTMAIWVMKEYGNISSWTKVSTILPEVLGKPVGISRVGELVIRAKGEVGLVKSDIQGRLSDDDKLQVIYFSDAFVYKESLISPKCFDLVR